MRELKQGNYYRYGSYSAIGGEFVDSVTPRFFVFHATDQDDVLGRKPRFWVEERVQFLYPNVCFGALAPAFVVTDAHRVRWPKEYAAFKSRTSWILRLRLWIRSRLYNPVIPNGHDLSLDDEFAKEIERANLLMKPDDTIGADLRAVFNKEKEKHEHERT